MLLAGLFSALIWLGCGDRTGGETAYSTPAATFKTLTQALSTDVLKGDQAAWVEQMQRDPAQIKAITRREITAERAINERIGYLLFDPSTLPTPRQSPFFYFIREAQGWKITSHLDTVFHRELEEAIQKGQFKLAAD